MKELLERWSQLEPQLCQLMPNYQTIDIRVALIGGYTSHHVEDDSFTNLDLAWIQWAIQQAIIEKGWSFDIGYDSFYGFGNEAEVNTSEIKEIFSHNQNSLAEALLEAYLEAMDATKKES